MVLDIAIIVFLMGLAILLVLLEVFLLPGITIAGIGGLLFAVGGITFAYMEVGTSVGNLTLITSCIAFGILFGWLFRSKALDKIALNTDVDSKITSNYDLNIHEGDEGITLSRLNPMGKVKINGITIEGKSSGDFIAEETPVVVVHVTASSVLVKLKQII